MTLTRVVGLDVVFLNQGGFSFTQGSQFNAKADKKRTWSIVGVRFDGDDFPDLAVATDGEPVKIFLNDCAGGFSDDQVIVTSAVGPSWGKNMVAADMNLDGQLDLLDSHTLLLNLQASFIDTFAILPGPVAVGDLNLDGIPDVVATNKIMLGVGQGYFATGGYYETGEEFPLADIALSDLDQDGDIDIVTALEKAPNRVYWNTIIPPPVVGDLDGELDVDFADFAMLASHYGATNCGVSNKWCERADLDFDNDVDLLDLGKLVQHWLEGTIP